MLSASDARPVWGNTSKAFASQLLFRNLDKREQARVTSQVRRQVFRPRSEIALGGRADGLLCAIIFGAVKAGFPVNPAQMPKIASSPNTLRINVAGPPHVETVFWTVMGQGEVVGELSVLSKMSRSMKIICLETTLLSYFEETEFRRLLVDIPMLNTNLVDLLARRIQTTSEHAQSLATLDVTGRVSRQLLCWSDQYGYSYQDGHIIPFTLTQSDLADLVGASREKINRVLQYFKAHHYISITGKKQIMIHNFAALERLCR